MSNIVIHPATQHDIDLLVAHPSHAVALYGPRGIGKTYIAEQIAAELLQVSDDHLHAQAYYRVWSPDEKGTITIEMAHEIVQYMKLKTTGNKPIRRVVIVEHAEAMTSQAQNALLKVIEEPPVDTVIILTAQTPQVLLATIRSRMQSLHVRMPEKQKILSAFADQAPDTATLERAYLLSGGMPGLLTALLVGDEQHPTVRSIQSGKEILAADTFTRLTRIDSFSNRDDTKELVYAIGQITRSGIAASAVRGNTAGLKKWHAILAAVEVAEKQLSMSGSPKLVLTDLFLHM